MTCLQVVADIEAKYRVKMAASSGRLEDALDAVTLHDGRRRPSRRSNYEILLKVCPPAQLPSAPCLVPACEIQAPGAPHSPAASVARTGWLDQERC